MHGTGYELALERATPPRLRGALRSPRAATLFTLTHSESEDDSAGYADDHDLWGCIEWTVTTTTKWTGHVTLDDRGVQLRVQRWEQKEESDSSMGPSGGTESKALAEVWAAEPEVDADGSVVGLCVPERGLKLKALSSGRGAQAVEVLGFDVATAAAVQGRQLLHASLGSTPTQRA